MNYIRAIFKTFGQLFLGYLRFHKKIFRGNNFFHRDNILAIIFTIFLLSSVFVVLSFAEAIDPISRVLSDADLTDFTYSEFDKNDDYYKEKGGEVGVSEDIVLVNIGDLDRVGIAQLVDSINKYKPAVIGMDVRFLEPKDMLGDILLENAFANTDKLVMASKGEGNYYESRNTFDSLQQSHDPFIKNAYPGLVNLPTEDEGKLTVCRSFLTGAYMQEQDKYIESFVVEIAKHYDSIAYRKFKMRENDHEVINFVGNIHRDFEAERPKAYFRTYDFWEFLEPAPKAQNDEDFKVTMPGKVVLLGYMGKTVYDTLSVEDKFYTPLNKKSIGKALPDMYGVVIHANSLDMILRGDYINVMPEWAGYLLGFIVVYFIYAAFRPIYSDHRIWYDAISKIMGLFLVLLLVSILIISYYFFNYEIRIPGICFAIIPLASDCLELYHGLLKNFIQRVKSNL